MNANAEDRTSGAAMTTEAELQRRAFNMAFAVTGLDWYWDARTYAELDAQDDGAARVAAFADELGETVDAAEVQAVQTQILSWMQRRSGTVANGDFAPEPAQRQRFAAE